MARNRDLACKTAENWVTPNIRKMVRKIAAEWWETNLAYAESTISNFHARMCPMCYALDKAIIIADCLQNQIS
jgi:hypothetical protein